VTSRISSLGIAMGYAIVLVPVEKLHGLTFALRLAIGLSSILWAKLRIQLRCIVSRVTRKKSIMGGMGQEEAGARSRRENGGFWARFMPHRFL